MIKPQELRLGNLFQDAKGRLCKTEQISIDPYETKIRAIDHSITSMPIAAIPLTEEWLIKFGFMPRPDAPWCMDKAEIMVNTGNHFIVHVHGRVTSVKHVHQLQNLYFALTGEELTSV